jgi:hypothetical protein
MYFLSDKFASAGFTTNKNTQEIDFKEKRISLFLVHALQR